MREYIHIHTHIHAKPTALGALFNLNLQSTYHGSLFNKKWPKRPRSTIEI